MRVLSLFESVSKDYRARGCTTSALREVLAHSLRILVLRMGFTLPLSASARRRTSWRTAGSSSPSARVKRSDDINRFSPAVLDVPQRRPIDEWRVLCAAITLRRGPAVHLGRFHPGDSLIGSRGTIQDGGLAGVLHGQSAADCHGGVRRSSHVGTSSGALIDGVDVWMPARRDIPQECRPRGPHLRHRYHHPGLHDHDPFTCRRVVDRAGGVFMGIEQL